MKSFLLAFSILASSLAINAQNVCSNGACTSSAPEPQIAASLATTSPTSSSNLGMFRSFVVAGGYAVAGVGVRGSGTGIINMTGVPSGAHVVAAYLYWETLGNGQSGIFNGYSVLGVSLGTVSSPCWSIPLITVYRSDVTGLLSTTGNGAYRVQFPHSGNIDIAPSTEGASLLIVYQGVGLPLTSISVYDGAYTLRTENPTFSLTIPVLAVASRLHSRK